MILADFFSDGDHDALPTDHGAHAERQGDRNLYPRGDELGGVVDVLFVIGQDVVSAAENCGV